MFTVYCFLNFHFSVCHGGQGGTSWTCRTEDEKEITTVKLLSPSVNSILNIPWMIIFTVLTSLTVNCSIAKAKARDIYNGLKLVSEYMAMNESSDYSEQLKRISKNMSDGVLTKKNLRDAFMRQYEDQVSCLRSLIMLMLIMLNVYRLSHVAEIVYNLMWTFFVWVQEQPSTDGGYSLDFLLGFSDDGNWNTTISSLICSSVWKI